MEMDAIDGADIESFTQVKECRNTLAHKLLSTLNADGLPEDFDECFNQLVELLRKVEVWWITNVEIPTNPDFDCVDVDEADIVPGPIVIIQLLLDIAHGGEDIYFQEFRKRSEG